MKYFELYSGIGGWRTAFNAIAKDLNVECECVGFSEIDPMARQVYRGFFKTGDSELEIANFFPFRDTINQGKPIPVRPGRKVNELFYGAFDMLVADIPCEVYGYDISQDNKTLYSNICWMVFHYRPEFVLIEAPWNMATYNRGGSLQSVINNLQSLGYFCSFAQLNSKDYGIPQDRPKVYIFASQQHEPYSFEFSGRMISIEDWVRYPSVNTYRSILNILEKDPKDKSVWISDQSKQFIFADTYNGKPLHHTLNGNPAMSVKPGIAKLQRANADNYYTKTFIDSEGRVNEVHTLEQADWKYIRDIRRLQIKECFLLQGFSEEMYNYAFHKYIPDTVLYKLVGQSTNVNTAYAILQYVFNEFGIK